jgi:hypothetical protein
MTQRERRIRHAHRARLYHTHTVASTHRAGQRATVRCTRTACAPHPVVTHTPHERS